MTIDAPALPNNLAAASGQRNWAETPAALGKPAQVAGFESIPRATGGFDDLLDIINPLQHIPVVGSLYRAATGDTIQGPAKMLGGLLFGGPLGLLTGVGSAVLAEVTGFDAGDRLLAGLGMGSGTAAARYAGTAALTARTPFGMATRI